MDKKPLIGVSICTVILLILGSLSNVVGYQSVKSTTISDSPLFSVRTKRAINQESRDTIASNYLGKGIESNFQFPIQESKTVMLQKFIDRIRMMDENEFGRFQCFIVSRLSEDKNNKNIDSNTVLSVLKQIRSHTKELPISQFANIGNKMGSCTFVSGGQCSTAFLECVIDGIRIIFVFLAIFLGLFTVIIPCNTVIIFPCSP